MSSPASLRCSLVADEAGILMASQSRIEDGADVWHSVFLKPIDAALAGRRRRTFGNVPERKEMEKSTNQSNMIDDIMDNIEYGDDEQPKQKSNRTFEKAVDDEEEKDHKICAESEDAEPPQEEVDRGKHGDKVHEESDSKEKIDPMYNGDKEASKEPPTRVDYRGKASKTHPIWHDYRHSVDKIFGQVDKEIVTVRDVGAILEKEYGIPLPKDFRKLVRERLVDLIRGNVEPELSGSESICDSEDDTKKAEVGGEESSKVEEVPSSEYDNEEENSTTKSKARGIRPSTKTKVTRTKKESKRMGRRKSTRKTTRGQKGPAKEHSEELRRQRMQELRVRNEELQLAQSAEDRKRAELIATKFETNTEELCYQRLEDRLALLQKLDQKRLQIMEAEDINKQAERLKRAKAAPLEEDFYSESEDEVELEIVGAGKIAPSLSPSLVLAEKSNACQKPTALAILDIADMGSQKHKNPAVKREFVLNLQKDQSQALSPCRKVNARAHLRKSLIKRQRRMGNMWLARELGYKNEREHLLECIEVEKKKRDVALQREAERLAINERHHLRERLFVPELKEDDDLEIDNAGGVIQAAGEQDEEIAMAKQVESDQANDFEPSFEKNTKRGTAGPARARRPLELAKTSKTDTLSYAVDPAKNSKEVSSTDNPKGSEQGIGKRNNEDRFDIRGFQGLSLPDARSVAMPMDKNMSRGDLQATNMNANPAYDNMGGLDEGEALQFETQAPYTVLLAPVTGEDDWQLEKSQATPVDVANGTAVTPKLERATLNVGDEGLMDTDDEDRETAAEVSSPIEATKKDRNANWKATLEAEQRKLQALKKRTNRSDFLETEADEEEGEEVAGLEDFGFSVLMKANEADEEAEDGGLKADDLHHIVDEISDDEGDEETGEKMRRAMLQKEEKERHKEMIRRMREGYDGRRGGITGGGIGARGMHSFDQLVAADNRAIAKQLGLLNDDELDSDDEGNGDKKCMDEEDEADLLDKMLKDRFFHRSNVELEENFSEDEVEDDNKEEGNSGNHEEDEVEQDMLAKRFAKRARMQRLMEEYGDSQEFSNARLMEDDTSMMEELSKMKNGLARKRSIGCVSRASSSSTETTKLWYKQHKIGSVFGGFLVSKGSLSLALKSSNRWKHNETRTSFLRSQSSWSNPQDVGISSQSISFSHVVSPSFGDSQVSQGKSTSQKCVANASTSGRMVGGADTKTASLWSKVMQQQKRG